jgi:phage shock protein E
MKKIIYISVLLFSCGKINTEAVLSPKDFDAKYKETKGALLLDVRTLQELESGKILHAENIVYDEAFASKLDTLKLQPIFIYCGSGKRSAKASKILKEKGYEVYELEGGINAWKEAGLAIN